ncbi:protein BPS1, chloroplastic-like [Juglans regia]|uniref:Protein BPS1, chloroplastic-like n=1 Tax=Juglans regia TaxID=51240 RepID=A0A2I4GKN7_JUGRE|nr:protein BPS1, chloroplastic-like [Juglans regia]
MVISVEKFSNLYSKLDNHLHHHPLPHQSEALSASLQAFQSDVSNYMNQLWVDSRSGSEILSLAWVLRCLGLLPAINKAFAKLLVDIDYPVGNWEVAAVDEYLSCSLSLLELFNSIASSLAYLGQARLPLAHALSLVENSPSSAIEHLKPIQPRSLDKDFRKGETKEYGKENIYSGKEWVIHEALIAMKSIGFWVCGIVLTGLCSDGKPYLEMRKSVGGLVFSSFVELDSSLYEIIMEKGAILKEIKELNDAVDCLLAALATGKHSEAAEELQGKLEISEKLLEELQKEVDHLFSEVLDGRNKMVDCLRDWKQ